MGKFGWPTVYMCTVFWTGRYLDSTSIALFQDCDEPDGKECNGIHLNLYEKSEDFCSCCPRKCIEYLKENEVCSESVISVPDKMCGPHLGISQFIIW